MRPERFQQIAELYHAVREGTAETRAALLTRADTELRREVESLLAQPAAEEFLERPAAAMAWLTDSEGPALADGTQLGPYRIERKLGEGGMGEVYRAIDTRLGRAVAIKLVHERFSARFRREARAIASLNHPNICTLYDIGPDYLVMELVEGDTLAGQLKHGALPTGTALAYAAQILAALAEAHAKGIVHRDLKPGNVMISRSGVKILDFGLAKSSVDEERTATGYHMGTPAYMSPEQRAGRPTDPRSDVWSFGCVLYEMLTGARVGTRRQRIPSRKLEAIVERCLEEDPAHRWQTVTELQQELATAGASHGWREFIDSAIPAFLKPRRVRAIVAVCLIAAAMTGAAWLWFARPARALTDQDTIVLADFTNRTGDPIFDGTLRQGLAVQLEQSPFLSIVTERRVRHALALMDRKEDATLTPAIALDLCQRIGSAAVIQGSIAQVGTPYQLTLRAVDCANGKTLASTQTQAPDKNHVLDALGTAASRLRTKLGESLGSVRKFDTPLEQATTGSLEALKAYSEGVRTLWAGSEFPSAIAQFKRAIELDPRFALAYGGLTIAYNSIGESRISAEYARKAYALRDKVSEPEKYFITARYEKSGTGNIDMAVQACLAWIQAYPRAAFPRVMLAGSIYPVIGEFDQAVLQASEGIRLMPDMPVGYAFLMDAYLALNRVADAKATWQQARKRNLHSTLLILNRYQLAFLRDDAAEMARQVRASGGQPDSQDQMLAYEAETAAYYGRIKQARAITGRAMDSSQRTGGREAATTYLAMSALRDALVGNAAEAERRALSTLEGAPARDAQYGAALAFAFAGNATRAEALADELASEYPEDTLVRFNYLPALRAKLALGRGDAAAAIDILKAATPYEGGVTRSSALGWTSLYPIYVRGEAYLAMRQGAEAAAEFRKILDHPGIVLNYPVGPAARLQRARALAVAGDRTAAAAYQDLLDLWKDADPDLPVLKQAQAEYARLH